MNSTHVKPQLKPTPRAIHFRVNNHQTATAASAQNNTNFAPQALQSKHEHVHECVVILINN